MSKPKYPLNDPPKYIWIVWLPNGPFFGAPTKAAAEKAKIKMVTPVVWGGPCRYKWDPTSNDIEKWMDGIAAQGKEMRNGRRKKR